jgi:hypothetical protein
VVGLRRIRKTDTKAKNYRAELAHPGYYVTPQKKRKSVRSEVCASSAPKSFPKNPSLPEHQGERN